MFQNWIYFLYCSTLFSTCLAGEKSRSTQNPYEDKTLVYDPWGPGNYLQFADSLDPNEIHLILEIGSRDALDAIFLGDHYHCPVYAFECNPDALKICRHNVKNYPFVTIVPKACWNETKEVPFYPVVRSKEMRAVNIGASSLLVARKDGFDKIYSQGPPIPVQATRLDEWIDQNLVENVDLLCMDCQGATYHVLEGLGKNITKIKYIITEVYLVPSYEGEKLYPEIKKLLLDKGFSVHTEPTKKDCCDVLFINRAFAREEKKLIP